MTGVAQALVRSLDCVHCGLCLQDCPTYRVLGLETDSPRGRIYLMRALAEGRIAEPERIAVHLDRCLDCRACETACPSGVRYGAMLEEVRGELRQRRRLGLSARLRGALLWHLVARQRRLRWAFRLARLAEVLGLRRLLFALRLVPESMRRLAPPIPAAAERRPLAGRYRPEGTPRGQVALFTGCIMEQMFGGVHRATLQVLVANGFEVVVPEEQGCCGALLLHDGQPDRARRLALANIGAFAPYDVIVNNSAGCGCALKEYGDLVGGDAAADFAARCRDISEFLAERGLTAAPAKRAVRVAYDDPCHLCHGQGVRSQPRELLRQVPGLELVEHDRPDACCGSAGIYNLVQPELAAAIAAEKVESLAKVGPDLVATGNPGCMLQLRSWLSEGHPAIRVVHPVELLLPERPPVLQRFPLQTT